MEHTTSWLHIIRAGTITIARIAAIIAIIIGAHNFGRWKVARAPRRTATFVFQSLGAVA